MLIIGILAAVALPQYQKAVMKSRIVAVKSVFHTLYQNLSLCLLEHPLETCGNLNELNAQYPSIESITTTDCSTPVDSCIQVENWEIYISLQGDYGSDGAVLTAIQLSGNQDHPTLSWNILNGQGQLTPHNPITCAPSSRPDYGGCLQICGDENSCTLQ